MKKRIVSILLALALVVAAVPQSLAATFDKVNTYKDGTFSDISSGDWFKAVVASAYELGLMNGSSEATFNPNGNISVAETVALAARIHNIASGGDGKFEQGSPWYQVYVDYATEKKILRDTYKDLGAKISRANFAFILANALSAEDLPAINDVPDGSLPDVPDNYKASAIYTLYRAGVLTGSDEFGTFKPDSTITRAEVAAIVSRMADKSQRKTLALNKKGAVSTDIFCGAIGYMNTLILSNFGMDLSNNLDEKFQDGTTAADCLKSEAISLITEFEAVRFFSLDNGITLTDAEKKQLETAKQTQINAAGGAEAFAKSLVASGLNEAFYDYFSECQMYYSKVSSLFDVDGKYGPSSASIASVLSDNYIRVKHILIQADPNDAEKKALAEKLCRRIKNGEDFEKLLEEYGEDPGMMTNPDGYLIDSYGFTPDGSQMIQEFTDASVALKVDGVSAVVPTSYGFHIIKRYPINKAFTDSYIKANNELFGYNAFEETLSAYIGKVVISNRTELEKIDVYAVFGK